MPKKEPVQIVDQVTSSMTDLRPITNDVFDVVDAKSDSFGSVLMLKSVTSFLGSNLGSKKVILSEGLLNSPVTVLPRSNKSKIIGFINRPNKRPISLPCDTSFMTALTLAETTALSPS